MKVEVTAGHLRAWQSDQVRLEPATAAASCLDQVHLEPVTAAASDHQRSHPCDLLYYSDLRAAHCQSPEIWKVEGQPLQDYPITGLPVNDKLVVRVCDKACLCVVDHFHRQDASGSHR